MLSHNEYVIWSMAYNSLRIAVGICNNVNSPIVYVKKMTVDPADGRCYSFHEGAMTMDQAKEIIETAKNGENRKVLHLILKYFDIRSATRSYEDIGYSQLTDMVSDDWFDSVKRLICLLDDRRCKGYYEIDIELEDYA